MKKIMRQITLIIILIYSALLIPKGYIVNAVEDKKVSVVEKELKNIIDNNSDKEVILENGIVLKVGEVVDFNSKISSKEYILTSNNNEVVIASENIITAVKPGTTFVLANHEGKVHVYEIYVPNPNMVTNIENESVTRGLNGQYTVMIDPGHGGTDSGALGKGIMEKNIVLSVSKKLRDKLEANGIKVIMTRETDVFKTLEERSTMANRIDPDVFISIHANAFNKKAYGIETYYYSDDDVTLSRHIQDGLISNTGANDRGIRFGNFHVIRENNRPSSLAELGFIDNLEEGEKLNDPKYQEKLVNGLYVGTMKYLKESINLSNIKTERIYGEDRYLTAIELFKKGWNNSDTVILASGEDFPDALCATPLAKKYNAPILLSKNFELKYQQELLQVIKDKKVKNVIIIGGTGVVPKAIESELKNLGVSTKRLGGVDRYETSVKIAKELNSKTGEIVMATGLNYADGLSVATIAAQMNMPILLSNIDWITNETKEYIKNSSIKKTYVVGGSGVVTDNVMKQLPSPERLGGNDRYETNEKIFNKFKSSIDLSNIYLASGEDFPDALSASALSAIQKGYVLLCSTTYTEEPVKRTIQLNKNKIKNAYVLGSDGLILNSVLRELGL